MSYLMSRALCRPLKGRFYSAQVMKKAEAVSEVVSARVNELTVVTADNISPLSRVMFLAKAGSRHEDQSNLGVTHAIRQTAYLATKANTSFTMFKHFEALGATLNIETTREYGIFSMNCTRNFLSEAFGLVAPMVDRADFEQHDWMNRNEACATKIAFDVSAYNEQPGAILMEALHAAAYRDSSVGNSLYCPQNFIGVHTAQQILRFMNAHYRPNRMVIVGTGVDHDELVSLVSQMDFAAARNQPNDNKAVYLGGERRVPQPNADFTYAALATEGPSLASKDLLCAGVLQHIMGQGSSIKYSNGNSFSRLAKAIAKTTKSPFLVDGLNVNYTDTGLFGFSVAAKPADIEKVLRTALEEFSSLTKTGVTDAEVSRGKTQLKASITMGMENEDAVIRNLAEQAIGSDKYTPLKDVLKMVDSIQTADVVNVAKRLVNGKPSMSAVGNLTNVPSLESLLK